MARKKETAILIHGLWMRGLVFLPHQYRLEKAGIPALRFSYPSWNGNLQSNVDRLASLVERVGAQDIYLVAHSLGGLVALTMLSKGLASRVRRLVLMGTPYAGCHCGNYMASRSVLSPLIGHSMRDWLTHPFLAIPETVDIGVIAGTRSWGLGRVIPGLPRPNDGVVAVRETLLPQARDTIALPVSHSGMLLSATCAEQVASFLRTGKFLETV